MASRIKNPSVRGVDSIKTPTNDDSSPAFSFKYLVNDNKYNLQSSCASKDLKSKLLGKLHIYSMRNWSDFIGDKKNTGVEKVAYSKLRNCKVNLPNSQFYNTVKDLTIFRISDSARIIGMRNNSICYILWIDWNLSSYDHGS